MDNPDDSDHVVVLLPCPFCGSTFTGKGGNYWECHDCFASGPTVDWDEPLQGDEFDKASAMQWNRRTADATLVELVNAASDVIQSTVDASTYPDGPNIDWEERLRLRKAIEAVRTRYEVRD